MFVAIFSALLATPVSVVTFWTIKNVLAAPTTPPVVKANKYAAEPEFNKTENTPKPTPTLNPTIHAAVVRSELKKLKEQEEEEKAFPQLADDALVRIKPIETVVAMNLGLRYAVKQQENLLGSYRELTSLQKEIVRYRESLKGALDKKKFDSK